MEDTKLIIRFKIKADRGFRPVIEKEVIRDNFLSMTKKSLLNITGVTYQALSKEEKEVLHNIIKNFPEIEHLNWLASINQ